ncbi:unnamed protein product [Euphydryas editha]|uniref:Zinc finger PHD-type domain-containing protein n=1 Tax=Euphydryas editha TaxID=104508 RepID=A0AAU9TZW8_EUPED|nr:unnamed protein product [Euphydryas editha]
MVQCKKCKLFVSVAKDDIIRCKGACEGVYHRKCGKGMLQKDLCDLCTKAETKPKSSPRIEVDITKVTVESLLQEVNKKLEVVFKIESKLTEMTAIVDFYSEKYEELITFKDIAEKKMIAMERKHVYLEKCNKALEERVIELEQKEKERNLEIAGLEMQEKENIKNVVTKIAEKLNLNPDDVEDAKRVGGNKYNEKQQRPRPVVVTLHTKTARDQWLNQRKTRLTNGNIYGNESKQTIYINEDLTKYKRQLLWSAKNQLKSSYNYIWVQNSNVLVKKSEAEKKIYKIKCEDDIKKLLDHNTDKES